MKYLKTVGITLAAGLLLYGILALAATRAEAHESTAAPGEHHSLGYDEIADEASGLTKRALVNFIGTGVACVDNPGATRTDCTITGGGSSVITDLTGTAWRVFYTDGSGDVTELILGGDGTFLKSNGATSVPSFATPAGGGNVSNFGTPLNDQLAVWTDATTVEGTTGLTYDGSDLAVTGNITVTGNVDGVDIAARDHATPTGAEIKTAYDGENFAANTILGNNTGSPAGPIELTVAQSLTLLGVEAGSTADQNDAEIKTAYENNSNTNEFDDTEQSKLAGIADNATIDQTGAEIKTAYDGENFAANTILGNNTGSPAGPIEMTVAQALTLLGIEAGSTADQIGSEIKTLYDGENFAANTMLGNNTGSPAGPIELTTTQARALLNVENAAAADQTDAQIKTSYEANSDTNEFDDTEQSKLAAIESLADVTGATNVVAAMNGATLLGSFTADEQGIEFLESDDAVTCTTGDYWIRADLSDTAMHKCQDGSETILDTTGGTPDFGTITGGTNTGAAMIVGTGASLAISGSGTIAATTAAALAADGGDCAAGSYPLGVDEAGLVEDCTDASTEIDSILATHTGIPTAHHAAALLLDGTVPMTGALTTDNLGIDFTDSDTNPGCAAGEYKIYADTSELDLKKCVNGTPSDLDTGGAEINDLTASVTWDDVPDANVAGVDERDEVCGTTSLSATCEINAGVVGTNEIDETAAYTWTGASSHDNATIDGGDSGSGTTRPAGSAFVKIRTHDTDCQTLTDGQQGEICVDEDDGKSFTCITADTCNSAAEWKRLDADSGGAPAFSAVTTGTNTDAGGLLIGTNGSLGVTGSGTIIATSGVTATAFFSTGEIADAQMVDIHTVQMTATSLLPVENTTLDVRGESRIPTAADGFFWFDSAEREAATVANLALKAALAAPALTGDATTATTAAQNDADTTIANTDFVDQRWQQDCATIETLVGADDDVPLFIPRVDVTIEAVACNTDTAATVVLQDWSNNDIDTIVCETDGAVAWETPTGTATLSLGEVMVLDTTSGTSTWTIICWAWSND